MKSLPRGPAGPGEVWPGASTDAGEFYRVPGLTSLPRQRPSLTPRSLGKCQNAPLEVSEPSESVKTRRWRFPRPRKASKHAAGGFRGLGKRQNTPLKVSEPSEGSKHAAGGFRGLGRVKQVFGSTIRGMKRASSVRGCSDEASEGGSTTPEAAQISATPCRVGWRGGRASYWPDRHAGGRHRGRDRG